MVRACVSSLLWVGVVSGCAVAADQPMFDRWYLGEAPYGDDSHATLSDEEGDEYPGVVDPVESPTLFAAGMDLEDPSESLYADVDLAEMIMVDDSNIPEEEVLSEEGDVSEEFAEDDTADPDEVAVPEADVIKNANPPLKDPPKDDPHPPVRDVKKAKFAKGEIDRFKFDGSVRGFACDKRYPKRSVDVVLTLRNGDNELLERVFVKAQRSTGDHARKECGGGNAHGFYANFKHKVRCGHKVGLIMAGAKTGTQYYFLERRKNKCSPIGETFNIKNDGVITGWACDQNGPERRSVVRIETSKGLKKNVRTNVASGGWINSRCSGGDRHRFKIQLGRKMACGETVRVYANNIDGSPGKKRVLIGKRKRPACPPPMPGASGHIRPLTSAYITSPFGYRWHPILKVYKLHTGTDFGAGSGTPVRATQSGTVILAGWNGGYGNMVAISHGNGVVTRFGHLSKIGVRKGQKVKKGATIGRVGSTGLSTGPHLHFEYMRNGSFKNPLNLF